MPEKPLIHMKLIAERPRVSIVAARTHTRGSRASLKTLDRRGPAGMFLRVGSGIVAVLLVLKADSPLSAAPLPKRLVIALDSIAYRDLRALQQGVDCTDSHGRPVHRQAFTNGYFPVSRLISTFPSTSDVAWT